MKNHVVVLTIDLDAMARRAMQILGYISLPFLWLYYNIACLVDAIVFYAPDVWKVAKRKAKVVKRWAVSIARRSKVRLIRICDIVIYSGLFISFLVLTSYQSFAAWFADAWAFRAQILAEC